MKWLCGFHCEGMLRNWECVAFIWLVVTLSNLSQFKHHGVRQLVARISTDATYGIWKPCQVMSNLVSYNPIWSMDCWLQPVLSLTRLSSLLRGNHLLFVCYETQPLVRRFISLGCASAIPTRSAKRSRIYTPYIYLPMLDLLYNADGCDIMFPTTSSHHLSPTFQA